MNLQTIIHEKVYINKFIVNIFILLSIMDYAYSWELDLSRRQKTFREKELSDEIKPQQTPGFFERLIDVGEPVQDVVLLNTKQGFLPRTIHLKTEIKYIIHVVNVNENEKNISFVLDAFSEHHATYYGKIKQFTIVPKKEGIFSFQCPETSEEGRMIVHASPVSPVIRQPASH